IAEPKPGDPHAVYLEWDLALRRVLVTVLAEAIGITVEPPAPLGMSSAIPSTIAMLQDAVQQFAPADDMQRMQQDAADRVAEYVTRDHAYGAEADRAARAEAAEILGEDHGDWATIDAALERFVQRAGPEEDARLLRFFHRQAERNVLVYGPSRIGHAAQAVFLPPLR
ncbi:MAG: aminoglycoside phosphotransferase, partial [Rhizorhabdus sp.]|nr:aminoglycoside phosphotransferase [Rhizorhabdus sp.]